MTRNLPLVWVASLGTPEPKPPTPSLSQMIQSDLDLFGPSPQRLAAQTVLLPGFVLPQVETLLDDLRPILRAAPFRHMRTPGGQAMAVALTNCGSLGWVSDQQGYRYSTHDPLTQQPWPALPESFLQVARNAAQTAGFDDFTPDACLINHYLADTKLSLHQDHDENDFAHPIVSISLGLPAVFLFGGMQRKDPTQRIALNHGDVLVWGGEDRLRFHGVMPVKPGNHPRMGARRINLTLRRAG